MHIVKKENKECHGGLCLLRWCVNCLTNVQLFGMGAIGHSC